MAMQKRPILCPECGAENAPSIKACSTCGAALGPRRPPPRQEMNDGLKYVILIGGLLVAVAIILFIAGSMSWDTKCADCTKGVKICTNCREGQPPKCPACRGNGRDPQNYSTCQRCNGKGELPTCPVCKGDRRKPCPTCGGDGKIEKD